MPLNITDLQNYITQLETLRGNAETGSLTTADLNSIATYYDYISANGTGFAFDYGAIAKSVVLASNTPGEFAGFVLADAAADNGLNEQITIDKAKVDLAVRDAQARFNNINNNGGNGFLDARAISNIHYNSFTDSLIGLSTHGEEAWGGSLFQEFGGDGSWVKLAQNIDDSDVNYASIFSAYADNLTSLGGVNAKEAIGHLEDATASLLSFSLLNLGKDSLGNLIVDSAVSTGAAAILESASKIIWGSRLIDLYKNSLLNTFIGAGEQIGITAGNGITFIRDAGNFTVAEAKDFLTALTDASEKDNDNVLPSLPTATIQAQDQNNTYTIKFGTSASESFLLSGDKYIVDGGDGNDTISYASSGSAVNVDLDAGNTLQSGIIGFKDIFDNIEAVTGRFADINQHIRNISLF